ncbi:F-box protein [Aspergillus mulundensis]|uniref:F-box domain-containing protein n=1 Tax=Aspergillus mulundensis TaxID=1810919 RepID=A0A3D8R4L1_9EURO|nr:hypothetical protein DSM5745_08753 [Aspergillus mulundensis]RDW68993.1 hypothetical protein DSM5745_08753 [Aspergillus mulundensis]
MDSPPVFDRAAIFKLSPEIMEMILSLLSVPDLARMALVCRAISAIAVPKLYHTILLVDGGDSSPLQRLQCTLFWNPGLLEHTRSLSLRDFNMQLLTVENRVTLDALVNASPNVRSFSLVEIRDRGHRLDLCPTTFKVLRDSVRRMRRVENLHLRTGSFTLRELMEALNDAPSLTSLSIYGYSKVEQGADENDMFYRSSNITTLNLKVSFETSNELEKLIEWPRRLVHFRDETFGKHCASSQKVIIKFLGIHKKTLESLDIGFVLNKRCTLRPLLGGFGSLERLTLPVRQLCIGGGHPTSRKLKAILARNLRTITLDFSLAGLRTGYSLHFQDVHESLIRAIVVAAVEKKASLMAIDIYFAPIPKKGSGLKIARRLGVRGTKYPWDTLDRIKDDIRTHGIQLTYNPPNVSKRQWKQQAKNEKKD